MRIYRHNNKTYSSLESKDLPNTIKYLGALYEQVRFFQDPEYYYGVTIEDRLENFKLIFVKSFKTGVNEYIFEINAGPLKKTKPALAKQAHDIDLEMCERIFLFVLENKKL
jgi:hypothetical protein